MLCILADATCTKWVLMSFFFSILGHLSSFVGEKNAKQEQTCTKQSAVTLTCPISCLKITSLERINGVARMEEGHPTLSSSFPSFDLPAARSKSLGGD